MNNGMRMDVVVKDQVSNNGIEGASVTLTWYDSTGAPYTLSATSGMLGICGKDQTIGLDLPSPHVVLEVEAEGYAPYKLTRKENSDWVNPWKVQESGVWWYVFSQTVYLNPLDCLGELSADESEI
jgi:hypothetical protein